MHKTLYIVVQYILHVHAKPLAKRILLNTYICCPLQKCAKCIRQCTSGITCVYLPLDQRVNNKAIIPQKSNH